jgi:molybdate transport system permease protein
MLSMQVSFLATAIALFLGIGFAWLLARREFWGKEWLDCITPLPLVLPLAVLGYY